MINYNYGTNDLKNWIIEETEFNSHYLGKCEAIMAQGNGYMGMRTSLEEAYLNEVRNWFVAGTFNKADDNEVTELPNIADVSKIKLEINGCYFTLDQGKIHNYSRRLNLKTGEVIREVVWESIKGDVIEFSFKKIVSLKDKHVVAQEICITPKNNDIQVILLTGIDGQRTNSGAQHFVEGVRRLYDDRFMQLVQTTRESNIDFVVNSTLSFTNGSSNFDVDKHIMMDRRTIETEFSFNLQKGKSVIIEKISNVFTKRDKYYVENEYSLDDLRERSLQNVKENASKGYKKLLEETSSEWQTKVWDHNKIVIDSEDGFHQLAIRFAVYHLYVMTPGHDNRMNIGAKGFSGEGYKGHTFWDTEIFMLPFWIFTNPEVARSLEEYRFNTIGGARKKALDNGYMGAQYPWESAWSDDGEVTPVWGAADIVTGKSTKIWSGFIEQHITSDVALGVWQYFKVTNDVNFMEKHGYEIMIDCAKFWASRLEYDEVRDVYCINNVIGPDEYKEHKNNNAFTNYTAYWVMKKALKYIDLVSENSVIKDKIDVAVDLNYTKELIESRVDKLYLPMPRKDKVIGQDDTYLNLKEIDLTKYKNQTHVGTLFRDYNLSQVNEIQVSKQADLLILFLLLEDMFDYDTKVANFNYYEARTLHDSSLSLSTHTILANDLGYQEISYDLFNRAINIDLGPNLKSSDHGIHAASIGGIWQSVVFGFGGVRMVNGKLRINPKLPESWNRLAFEFYWHGCHIEVDIKDGMCTIKNNGLDDISLQSKESTYIVGAKSKLEVKV